MSLTATDVNKVAHLARLAVKEQEITKYASELSNILGLVAQMDAIDTQDVAPMAHPLNLSQPLRDDKVTEPDQRDLLLSLAPQTEAGLFIVPKVIE